MPLFEGFDFLRLGFDVAYRGSRESQALHISVTTADKGTRRTAPIIVKRLIELINSGAACGSLFLPEESFAERVSGPWDGPDAFGPDFSWVLRVNAVSPLFVRTMVDQLRKCGYEHAVTTMRIWGELLPDKSAQSVDTKRMLSWLDDPNAYVDESPKHAFSVEACAAPSTYFKVITASPIEPPFADALKHTAMHWLIATAAYVDDGGRAIVRTKENLEKHLPAFEVTGTTFSARFEEFLHRFSPSRAVLVNMLAKMAATGADIMTVEIGHPAAKPAKAAKKKSKKVNPARKPTKKAPKKKKKR